MGRVFIPAHMTPGTAPLVAAIMYATGQTFKKGALLVLNGAGQAIECAANPAKVVGVAGQNAGSGYGYDAANSPTVITGQEQVVSVCVAERTTTFSGRLVNGGTDPVTPAQTDLGVSYGVLKVGTDWVVDQSNTTNLVVKIVGIDADRKVVFFKFLDAVLNFA